MTIWPTRINETILMKMQQRINQQRIRHIIDSYMLAGMSDETDAFDAYVNDLLSQYPQGLIEIALVETLTKSWLTVPMQRGVAFLRAAHERLNQWQLEAVTIALTPSQFSHITGLDPQLAFSVLTDPTDQPTARSTQTAVD